MTTRNASIVIGTVIVIALSMLIWPEVWIKALMVLGNMAGT